MTREQAIDAAVRWGFERVNGLGWPVAMKIFLVDQRSGNMAAELLWPLTLDTIRTEFARLMA